MFMRIDVRTFVTNGVHTWSSRAQKNMHHLHSSPHTNVGCDLHFAILFDDAAFDGELLATRAAINNTSPRIVLAARTANSSKKNDKSVINGSMFFYLKSLLSTVHHVQSGQRWPRSNTNGRMNEQ